MELVKVSLKKAALIITLSFVLITGINAPHARAHELESSNGVSAIFHIEPDDNPVAGESTVLNLLFSDEAGGFKLSNYNLKVELKQDEKLWRKP